MIITDDNSTLLSKDIRVVMESPISQDFVDVSLDQSARRWLPVNFVTGNDELGQRIHLYLFTPKGMLPHLPSWGFGLAAFQNSGDVDMLRAACSQLQLNLCDPALFSDIREAKVTLVTLESDGIYRINIVINGGTATYDYSI
jgi:hypothetical protein